MGKHNIVATLIFAAFTSVAVADHHKTASEQTATAKEFEELRDRLNGRWISDLKVNILWPKLGVKKGDTTTIFADYDADLDGMVFGGERKLGHIKWKQTFHYDAGKSVIVANCVGSNGFWSQEHWWKISEHKFGKKFQGGQRDGSTFSGSATWTFSADGKTVTSVSSDVKQGDSDESQGPIVWERISN